jgi:hypothetical protein
MASKTSSFGASKMRERVMSVSAGVVTVNESLFAARLASRGLLLE